MEKQCATHDIMLSLDDTMKFIDWISDKSYKRCINGEWIQTGTDDYQIVARNTIKLYELFKYNESITVTDILNCEIKN